MMGSPVEGHRHRRKGISRAAVDVAAALLEQEGHMTEARLAQFLAATGIRASEALRLRRRDITSTGFVTIFTVRGTGKGDARLFPLPENAAWVRDVRGRLFPIDEATARRRILRALVEVGERSARLDDIRQGFIESVLAGRQTPAPVLMRDRSGRA